METLGLTVKIDVVSPSTHRERVANGKAMAFSQIVVGRLSRCGEFSLAF
jgi:hypothetical protein